MAALPCRGASVGAAAHSPPLSHARRFSASKARGSLRSASATAAALLAGQRYHRQGRHHVPRYAVDSTAMSEELRQKICVVLEVPGGASKVPSLLEEAIAALQAEGDDASVAECFTVAVEMLLERKAFQEAVKLYIDWNDQVESVPLSLRCAVMRILGTFSNFDAAADHVRDLMETQDLDPREASKLFDGILSGVVQSQHPLTSSRADVLIREMMDAGVKPTGETLRLVVEAKSLFAAPAFLIDLGQTVLEIIRRFETSLNSSTLLAISGAHLRTGDLDAAYRWFLASQLIADRQTLNDEPTLGLVSQLARALAIGGRACQVKRLLLRVKEDGGQLPSDTASVSLSGYSCGRSLATCWLEPPPEVLRRRSIWASDSGAQVTCAEQWDWKQQEMSRQEIYQWYPYLSPETKLERAWMTPLRSMDRGALGLARQWAGQTPAEASARERLHEETSEAQPFDLEAALALEPPGRRVGAVAGRPVVLRPEAKTWRMYHADAVKKAYPTSMRTTVASCEELREVLLAEKSTRLMFGAKAVSHPVSHRSIEAWVSNAEEETIERLRCMEASAVELGSDELVELVMDLSGRSESDIKEDPKLNPSRLRHIVSTAVRFSKGDTAVPLTDEEYRQRIMDMTEEQLEEAFQKLKTSVNDSILGAELTEQVEAKLLEERREDSAAWAGSAGDELRLALDVAKTLQALDLSLTPADVRALLQNAHALNDAQLAEEALELLQELPSVTSSVAPVAQDQLCEAMVRGGWEAQSTKEFLQGERLVPLRDQTTALGKLQTKYLDPLQGMASGSADGLLEALSKPFEGRLIPYSTRSLPKDATTADSRRRIVKDDDREVFEDSVQWDVKAKDPDTGDMVVQQIEVTRQDVLRAELRSPSSCDLLRRLSSSPRLARSTLLSASDVGKLLQEMGLPVPSRQDKKQELLYFAVRVLQS